MRMRSGGYTFFVLCFCFHFHSLFAGPLPPSNLRTQRLPNPLGVDVSAPLFSWTVQHTDRKQTQLAFRLVLSQAANLQPVLWDTGKVSSSSPSCVYKGPALVSDSTYFWTVYWWDSQGTQSLPANTQTFGTAFLNQNEWNAQWISTYNNTGFQLKKDFSLSPSDPVVRARAYVTGLGYFELRLNGQKVGDSLLDPAWTTFNKRVLYSTFDVTSLLRLGGNSIAALLGSGWPDVPNYAPWVSQGFTRVFLLQLHIQLQSGAKLQIVSDSSWIGGSGALVNNSIYDGEVYDARLEQPGWDLPGWKPPASWRSAVVANFSTKTVALNSQLLPPIKKITTLPTRRIITPSSGVYVFDFDQNLSGWCRLKLRGPLSAGTRIQLHHAEVLMHPPYGPISGNIYVDNLRSARQTDVFITADIGQGEVVEHEPHFTVHGFRFVELTGLPYAPTEDTLTAVHVRSSVERLGSVSFGNETINAIQHNIVWGQEDNLMSVPTDCDQRDERKGWMGDAALTSDEASRNFDMSAFYVNFLQNIQDTQTADGQIADTTPVTYGGYPADPAWGTAFPTIAYSLYREYGDLSAVSRFYPALKLYVQFLLKSFNQTGAANMFARYGDWVPPPLTPGGSGASAPSGSLTSVFSLMQDLLHIQEMAAAIGQTADAQRYGALLQSVRAQFHQAFYYPSDKSYGQNGLQTAIVLALIASAVPDSVIDEVVDTLVTDLVIKRHTHLSTGIIGARWICQALTQVGRADLALQLVLNKDYPSWGFMIYNTLEPATTLWELWDTPYNGPGMNSRNHIMFGGVGEWFYSGLLGISQAPGSIAYQNIIFRPVITTDPRLPFASGSLNTPRGRVALQWLRTPSPSVSYAFNVSVPVGSVAQVFIPCEDSNCEDITITESRVSIWQDNKYIPGVVGVTAVSNSSPFLIINISSGDFAFSSSNYFSSHRHHHHHHQQHQSQDSQMFTAVLSSK